MPVLAELFRELWQTTFFYATAFVVVRAMGKRSISAMAPFDIVVIIIIGEVVALGIEEDGKPVWHAAVPIVFLGLLQVLIAWISLRWRRIEKLTQGASALIVKDGRVIEKHLLQERVSKADLITGIREQGIDRLEDVAEARLEPTGKISVIPTPAAAPLSAKALGLAPGETLDAVVARHVERLRKEILSALQERRPQG